MVPLQQPNGSHYPLKAAPTLGVNPIGVVQRLGPIQGNAHKNPVLPKEGAPSLIQQQPIGLQRQVYPAAIDVASFQNLRGGLEELQARKGGLAALKGNGNLTGTLGQGLLKHVLQGLQVHSGQELHSAMLYLVGVEAIAASEIAKPACRLDHNVQIWSHIHYLVPNFALIVPRV